MIKNFFIFSISLVGFSLSTFANSPVHKDLLPLETATVEEGSEIITDDFLLEYFGRQCCTVTNFSPSTGSGVSVTACSGWFLSNTDNSYNKACEKATVGFESLYGEGHYISTTIQK